MTPRIRYLLHTSLIYSLFILTHKERRLAMKNTNKVVDMERAINPRNLSVLFCIMALFLFMAFTTISANAQEGKGMVIATGKKIASENEVVNLDYRLKTLMYGADNQMKVIVEFLNSSGKSIELLQKSGNQSTYSSQVNQLKNKPQSKKIIVTILEDGTEKIILQPDGQLAALTPYKAEASTKEDPTECIFFPFVEGSEKIVLTILKTYEAPDGKLYTSGTYELIEGKLVSTTMQTKNERPKGAIILHKDSLKTMGEPKITFSFGGGGGMKADILHPENILIFRDERTLVSRRRDEISNEDRIYSFIGKAGRVYKVNAQGEAEDIGPAEKEKTDEEVAKQYGVEKQKDKVAR